MNQTMESKQLKEIHVDKMHFCVISKHPQYSSETAAKIKRDMRRELYQIFKNYRQKRRVSASNGRKFVVYWWQWRVTVYTSQGGMYYDVSDRCAIRKTVTR